jgi:hypothetical protein
VAATTLDRDMFSSQSEFGLVVIKSGPGPGLRAVAITALFAKFSLVDVILFMTIMALCRGVPVFLILDMA